MLHTHVRSRCATPLQEDFLAKGLRSLRRARDAVIDRRRQRMHTIEKVLTRCDTGVAAAGGLDAGQW